MGAVSFSLKDFLWVCIIIALLLAEWNIGSNVPVDQQKEFFMYIAAWAVVLTCFSFIPYDERLFAGDTFSFKCAALSAMQQVLTTTLGVLLVVKFYGQTEKSGMDWMSAGAGPQMTLERQVHFACIASMIKDFWLPDDLASTFILHHILGAVGCGMCLILPVGFGAATLNACQAESTSILFNIMFVLPVAVGGDSKAFRFFLQWLYMIGMIISHVVAMVVGVYFAMYYAVPGAKASDPWWTWWRVMYAVFCILLLTFRIIGQLIYGSKIISTDFKPELAADEKKSQ